MPRARKSHGVASFRAFTLFLLLLRDATFRVRTHKGGGGEKSLKVHTRESAAADRLLGLMSIGGSVVLPRIWRCCRPS